MVTLICRPMCETEAEDVSALASRSFLDAVAPYYSREGVEEFLRYAAPGAIQKRNGEISRFCVCESGEELVGILELRAACHIAMFFVRPDQQRRGIGRRLLKEAVANCRKFREGVNRLTVHSSPNAVAAYERFGFQALGGEQEMNGIRFTLMAFDLQDQSPLEEE